MDIVFERYDADYEKQEGTYKRRLDPYGLVEEGRFAVTPDRGLFFPFEDPLKRSPGEYKTSDYAAKRLRMITPAGQVRTLVGRDLGGAQEGPARLATIQMPWGVDVLPNGDVIFASNGCGNVGVFRRNGPGD